MTFCENLLKLRVERSVSQKDLTEAIGVGLRAYQRYEYGEREPQLSVLVALADFYKITLDELVGREQNP
ncbi:MAG: helix-turn-helix transcriptional regulator [Oscillibacter sp.]